MTNIHCTNYHRYFVKVKNRLKCYKLKLLLNTNKVSGSHIKQYIEEKVKIKEMITNKIINYRKKYKRWRNYLVANTKIKICK